MAVSSLETGAPVEPKRSRFRLSEKWLAPLLLAPSLIALFVFVYGFIGFTFWVSLSNWRSATRDLSLRDPIWTVYERLFQMPRFQADLRNIVVYTILFLLVTVVIGLGLAIVLDQQFAGKPFFRFVFLFPYALSFIVTGVAWRWIFNPEIGLNLLFEQLGLNRVLGWFGMGPFKPGWLTNPTVVGDMRTWFPGMDGLFAQMGIPLAMIPVTIAAVWQLSGFAMAMYLAGLGTIPMEVREAAQLDGASTMQMYRQVILPLLKPVTVSVLIILTHVSLKIFDLIYAMSGSGPGFATDVPGIFVFEQTFRATRYDLGAAASIVMLVLVAFVIVPYLARSVKEL
ncbi:MAG: sugar ABC transporter permease [Thermomicrobiales bacterium]|nr:sugar ABC transporter permease [Thermomicrobiales bacterium]